jgi:hypothetical protein
MLDPDYTPADRPLSLKDEPLSPEDAVRAMLEGEALILKDEGRECLWSSAYGYFTVMLNSVQALRKLDSFDGLHRRPAKRKRVWTRWEILDWANSPDSRGWVVRQTRSGNWVCPQALIYALDSDKYERARFSRDGVDESTICGFEVEE